MEFDGDFPAEFGQPFAAMPCFKSSGNRCWHNWNAFKKGDARNTGFEVLERTVPGASSFWEKKDYLAMAQSGDYCMVGSAVGCTAPDGYGFVEVHKSCQRAATEELFHRHESKSSRH
jgi:hypothetical protein